MYESFKKAIMKELKKNFKDHTIYGENVPQGFKRPCFFVSVTPVVSEFIGKNRRERVTIFDVIYFSENETKAENLKMMDELSNMFMTLDVNGKTFICKKQRFNVVDDLLHYMFNVDLIEFDGSERGSVVHEVKINKGVY